MIVLKVLFYREDPRLREQEWGNFQVGCCQTCSLQAYSHIYLHGGLAL